MPTIPAIKRLKEEDHWEVEAGLVYIVILCPKPNKSKQTKTQQGRQRWLSRLRYLVPNPITPATSLGPTERKERTGSHKLL